VPVTNWERLGFNLTVLILNKGGQVIAILTFIIGFFLGVCVFSLLAINSERSVTKLTD
jgi:hypothetical protein